MGRKRLSAGMFIAVIAVFLLSGAAFAGGKPYTILLAGYGWYAGIPEGQVNNAEDVALALDGEMVKARDENGRVIAQGKVHSIVVPVTWGGAFPPVEEAIQSLHPDIVVGLGTAGDMRPEPYGSNLMNGCDANPENPDDVVCMDHVAIDSSGPDYREGTLPYTEIVLAMLKAGIPAYRGHKVERSDGYPYATPGWYLCNYMAYMLPKYKEDNGLDDMDVGFIHIATRPQYQALDRLRRLDQLQGDAFESYIERSVGYSLELDRTIDAIRIALEETVRARAQRY